MNSKQFYVVDKETGAIIGETNDRHPFKRILAFIVLYLLSLFTRLVTYYYICLLSWLLDKIFDMSRLAYYLCLFFGGTTAIGILIMGFMLGAHLMYTIPEKIIPSRKGTRYFLLGIVVAVFYLVSMITMIAGISASSGRQYVWHVIVIIFFVVFAFFGRNQSNS